MTWAESTLLRAGRQPALARVEARCLLRTYAAERRGRGKRRITLLEQVERAHNAVVLMRRGER